MNLFSVCCISFDERPYRSASVTQLDDHDDHPYQEHDDGDFIDSMHHFEVKRVRIIGIALSKGDVTDDFFPDFHTFLTRYMDSCLCGDKTKKDFQKRNRKMGWSPER